MLPLHHILLPVDFSERCSALAGYVRLLATNYKAKVSLLHVAEYVFLGPTGVGVPPLPIENPQDRISELQEWLESFAAKHFYGVSTTSVVRQGDPAQEIVDYANTESVDLIAMPTHGRGIFRRFLLGSITAKVIHDATVPVLTGAHLEAAANGDAAIKHVLCGIALDQHSRNTIALAATLACDMKAKLGIVHAIPAQDARLAITFGSDWERDLVEMCKARMHELEQDVGTTADVFVKLGKPSEVIAQLAAAVHADLVIVGRSGAGGSLHGDAYDVIRHSPCPVLSV
ncbi:MAG: universal stress protein [Bryobacteraceae bacterium]